MNSTSFGTNSGNQVGTNHGVINIVSDRLETPQQRTDHDETRGIQLDFFFSARGTEMQCTPLGMFRSLLNQIFDRDTTVRSQVRETYEQRCTQFGGPQWEWPRVSVTVFVDALDEAGAESAQQLATYFHWLIDRAGTKKSAVQICISCRHYPIMGNAQAIEINVEDHNREDIARYIEDALTDIEVEDGFVEETREAMAGQLIQQANGVFQWAHLIMPIVKKKILEGESFDDIRRWLREIPAGLEDVYVYILNEVIEDSNRRESFVLFQWICLAERPLTVTEMRYALAASNARMTSGHPRRFEDINGFVESNERMKRRMKALSGGLTEVVLSGDLDETVQIIHQSVNDSLRAKGLRLLHQHIASSTPPVDGDNTLLQCQAALYQSCMVYLASANLSRILRNDLEKTKENLTQDLPFLDYATINLFIHAEKAAGCRADAIQNELDMLQQVVGGWVQSYQILNWRGRACPSDGSTLLHIAAATNLIDVMESVLLNGEDVATQDGNGSTAFHLAAQWGHILAGKLLLEKGAEREARCKRGRTPLIEAASFGNLAFVEWLLNDGASLESIRGTTGEVLQAAALGGHQGVVEILIGAGAKVNAQGGTHGNALQAAACNGSTEIVRMLLDAQADVNAQGGYYGNALQAATFRRSAEIVQMLLDAQANVNAQGGKYGSPLLAAVHKDRPREVQILLSAGADGLLADELGQTPLHIAAWRNMLHIIDQFPLFASAVNNRNKLSQTPLHLAVYRGHVEFALILLNLGADPSLLDGYGRNIMDWAHGNKSLMRQIRDHCPQVILTPTKTQNLSLHRSVFQLSDTFLHSRLESP
ncbi:hypothetical protein N7486_001084 [Penicillium sp. IBT 16267x]|nr:hypothetical protein N7486_001084 [Penicillium sp. IBT 16267x]